MLRTNLALSNHSVPVGLCACLGWLAVLLLSGCTDPYLPAAIKAPPSYLVVDGFINPQGISSIKLSRTYAIGSALAPPPETKATAYVEEENGPRYTLREAPAGTYSSAALALNPAKKYRLHLTTAGGKEYASDFVPDKLTPPIDAITWKFENSEFRVLVSAHDATNSTQYYRWDYDETWEIRPAYDTGLEYTNHALRFRAVPLPRVCWGTDIAKTVQIDKTTSLAQDVVAEHRLRVLPANTERLFTRYSILVRQYALTKEEYAYWDLLRKNTESIGTLFDPQPAQLTGNVHCVSNPAEPVLGFVGAHTVTEKRIFIARADLPAGTDPLSGYEKCIPPEFVSYDVPGETIAQIQERVLGKFDYLPVVEGKHPLTGEIGIFVAVPNCLDCRLRGTVAKPSFWP
ncbi:DUF4249 domain-containing protein [Hymenobacter sp. BT770]|uniref:DUF4249 domain-containing protein n=1 Tax=Hymenobacter sp. BT770 TaxID=2886942 RepID=UPI001D0FD8BF|nr:DUF4249 domain-containing protein [Hymenobacter sp. BT770]MCC3154101.1 DUF4249 domain-containing protein [Hymenobacter sp. BT770]MDO3416245.1 DUF4249 domain-containing protein [Hymenobacter sp. BT770]